MGMIVDQNEDENAIDNWAVITGTTVSNIIAADLLFVQSVQENFDYLVDITVGEQSPVNVGDIYDPEMDTFSSPPVDYAEMLRADINAIQNAYNQALLDYSAAVSASEGSEADSGISAGISDASGTYSMNEETPFTSLVSLISSGG